jgi:WD40 repeat protein
VIWDRDTSRERRRVHSDDGHFNGTAFSHDGRTLAAGLNGQVHLCDPSSGNVTEKLSAGMDALESVAFLPGDRVFVASGNSGIIHLWDPIRGMSKQITSGQGRLWCVACSPDGRTLATTSADGTVRLKDLIADRAWISIPSPPMVINNLSMAFIAEGSKFVVSLRGDVWTYETRTGRPLSKTRLDAGRPIFCTALSSDATLLAMSDEIGSISLWDLATNRRLQEFPGPRVKWATSFSISHGGKCVAGISSDKKTFVLDTANGSLTRSAEDMGQRLAVLPDGKCTFWGDGAMRPFLWDPASGRTRTAGHLGHRKSVQALSWSPDGKLLATAGADGKAVLWSRQSLECLSELYGHVGGIASVAFSPDGRTLATAGDDRIIRLWDIASRVEVASLEGHSGPITHLLFSPDGMTLASTATKSEGFEVMLRPAWPIEYAPKLSP